MPPKKRNVKALFMGKQSLLVLCFVFAIAFSSSAQKTEEQTRKGKIGITFSSFGNTDGIQFAKGAAGFTGKSFYGIGFNYIYSLNRCLDLETGFEYSHYNISVHPNLPPDMDNTPYDTEFLLINMPLTLRVNFLKYCFINSGLNLEFGPAVSNPVGNQDGIGAIIGIGLKYEAKPGISAFINPYAKVHSLIPFSSPDGHQRILESGFRLGVMYRLK